MLTRTFSKQFLIKAMRLPALMPARFTAFDSKNVTVVGSTLPHAFRPSLDITKSSLRPFSTDIKPSVYDRIGGAPAVEAAVEIFYGKILADERISFMFKNTEMKKLKRHQKRFLTMAMGGPNNYEGSAMRSIHKNVNLGNFPDEDHFGAVAECLVGSLKELEVPQELIDEVVAIVLTVKDDVLGK